MEDFSPPSTMDVGKVWSMRIRHFSFYNSVLVEVGGMYKEREGDGRQAVRARPSRGGRGIRGRRRVSTRLERGMGDQLIAGGS